MKNLFSIICLSIVIPTIGFSQIQTFYVRPSSTDINYSSSEDSNYIVRNTTVNLNKLVLFIGGSFSSPKDYSLVCQYPATIGFDVISLRYPNDVAAASLGVSSDSLIFNKYRQELCFGTPQSADVSVDTLNSIYTRTLKLIKYLASAYPSQNWSQYLASPTSLNWNKIVVSGHSQGSGHACYLSKYYPVERVLMFAGPNDYSIFYSNAANWLRKPGVTPINKHFALLHLRDEVVPFSHQFANLKGLGLLQSDDSTLVDKLASPYSNSRFLYINTPALSYHSAPIGGNAILPAVWNYMLTSTNIITGVDLPETNQGAFNVYPNPVVRDLTIEILGNIKSEEIIIFDAQGRIIHSGNTLSRSTIQIDFSTFPKGLYFILIGGEVKKVVKN